MNTHPTKPVRKPTQKWTVKEKLAFCQSWEESGLTRAEFSRRTGISTSALCSWIKQRAKEQKASIKFVGAPLNLEQQSEEQSFEVKLPNGLQCRFPRVINIAKICQIIEGLQQCHY